MIIGVTISEHRPFPKDLESLKHSNQILEIKAGRLAENIGKCDVLYVWNLIDLELKDYISIGKPLPKVIYVAQQGIDFTFEKLLEGTQTELRYAAGVFSESIAEYALASIMMLAKNLHKLPLQHSWIKHEQMSFKDMNVLILGRGSISNALKELLSGMKITNKQIGSMAVKKISIGKTKLDTVNYLSNVNMVVCCLPLSELTVDIVNSNFFRHFSNANFINISRGKVVNMHALKAALDNGNLTSALLDAFEEEPLPDNDRLWSDDRIVISPHQSYRSIDWASKLHSKFIDDVFSNYEIKSER
ncbi:hypothetical protein H7142_01325 [Candidatus Saccharibacteria bacterium]|nr:hypothetical protein [Candidatus Saccharibacteria bacterium]